MHKHQIYLTIHSKRIHEKLFKTEHLKLKFHIFLTTKNNFIQFICYKLIYKYLNKWIQALTRAKQITHQIKKI